MATTIQTIEKPTKARALDTSGNNNHGQIYSGRGLEFDGVTDYFLHNGGTGITGVNNFGDGTVWTFAVWIRFNDTSSNTYFVGKSGSTQPHLILKSGNTFEFRQNTSALYFKFKSTLGGATDASAIEDNTWYRLVLVSDGTNFTLYLNGQAFGYIKAGDSSTTSGTFTDTEMWFTGWGIPYGPGTQVPFDGMMSDGQVWNGAWTADDVLYDYNNPESLALNAPGTSLTNSNLKIWYPMNDGHRGQQSYILDASNTGLGDELLTTTDLTTIGNQAITAGTTLNGWTHHATYQYDSITASSDGIRIVSNGSNDLGSAYQSVHSNSFVATEGVTYRLEYTAIKNSGGDIYINVQNNPVGSSIIATGSNEISDSVTNEVIYFTADNSSDSTCFVDVYTPATRALDWTISYISIKPVNDKHHATTVFTGDEIAVNGSFAADSDWTKGTGWTIGSGTADCDGSQSGNTVLSQTYAGGFVEGRTYQVQFTISDYTAGEVNPHITGANSGGVSGNGTKTSTIVATSANNDILMYADSLFDAKIDDVSIKEVGTATGWTDADQQLDIPQTALQSYNQLAMPHGASNHKVDFSDGDSDLKFTTGNHSFSFWFCPQSTSNQYVLSKGAWGTSGYYIYFASTSKLQYHTNQSSHGGNQYNSLDDALTLGKWYHCVVAISDSGTDSQWYINGEKENKKTDHIASAADTRNLQLYNRGGGSNNPDSGLTELSVWNKTLSQSEVNELYNDGMALDCKVHSASSDLLHYWRNNGLATWTDIGNAGSLYNGTPGNITETMLITAGADGSRDSQGFLMNRQKLVNSLNTNEESYTSVDINHTFGTADFSYGFWFKLEDTENGYLAGVQSIGNSTGVGLTIDAGDGKIRSRPFGVTAVYTSAAYDDGEWHYAHHNIDRSANAILYIDGTTAVLTQDISGVTGNSLSTNSWNIGAESGTSNFLAGEIDDFVVYSDVLTTAEIIRNFNAGKRSHR